jgi:hypothetical protein
VAGGPGVTALPALAAWPGPQRGAALEQPWGSIKKEVLDPLEDAARRGDFPNSFPVAGRAGLVPKDVGR